MQGICKYGQLCPEVSSFESGWNWYQSSLFQRIHPAPLIPLRRRISIRFGCHRKLQGAGSLELWLD